MSGTHPSVRRYTAVLNESDIVTWESVWAYVMVKRQMTSKMPNKPFLVYLAEH